MKKSRLLLALSCMFCSVVYSQSNVSDAYARLTPQSSDTLFDGVFTVEVSDTSTTSAIEVKLGTIDGISDLVDFTFNYDVNTGLPTGFYYSRTGNLCTLGVGTLSAANTLFGEVRIHRSDNTWSSPYKFISN